MEKALFEYHGVSQAIYCRDLLLKYCSRVFLSCRKDQEPLFPGQQYQKIYDHKEYSGIGPLGGVLSAMDEYPQASWLVLACDMPFVKEATISHIIQSRDSDKEATVYVSENGFIEPLCALYEASIRPRLNNFFKNKNYSLNKILLSSAIKTIKPVRTDELMNINDPEEAQKISRVLRETK